MLLAERCVQCLRGKESRSRQQPCRGLQRNRVTEVFFTGQRRQERPNKPHTLFDSFGKTLRAVYANRDGIVIGRTEAPLVNSGDAVVHIAS